MDSFASMVVLSSPGVTTCSGSQSFSLNCIDVAYDLCLDYFCSIGFSGIP